MVEDKHQPYDKSSKWLIQHHGDSILRLAGIEKIAAWRPAQAEVVQPSQLPDGLLEVRLEGESRDDLFLLEVATYPERRVEDQLLRDLMLVYLDRGELPEAVTLVLRPKGKYQVPASREVRSRRGLSSCRMSWRVVELWAVPAEELLQAGDVGLVPWVPLADFTDPPERMMLRCREAIEHTAPPGEKANLLAVTQVLAYLRYNSRDLLKTLGGKEVMLEVPFLDEIVEEKRRDTAHDYIVTFLEGRFGEVPRDLVEAIGSVVDEKQLKDLARSAATCADVDAFRRTIGAADLAFGDAEVRGCALSRGCLSSFINDPYRRFRIICILAELPRLRRFAAARTAGFSSLSPPSRTRSEQPACEWYWPRISAASTRASRVPIAKTACAAAWRTSRLLSRSSLRNSGTAIFPADPIHTKAFVRPLNEDVRPVRDAVSRVECVLVFNKGLAFSSVFRET